MKSKHRLLICVCVAIIFIYSIIASIYNQQLVSNSEALLRAQFDQAELLNEQWQQENNSNGVVVDETEPLFANAYECLNGAYNNLINCSSYSVSIAGKSTAIALTAASAKSNIVFNNYYTKQDDQTYTTESRSYVETFPSQSIARQKYFASSGIYSRKADSVKMSGSEINPSYSSNTFIKTDIGSESLPLDDFYVLTKDTITDVKSFKIVRDPLTKKILRYETQVTLNPFTSAVEYGITMMKSGEFIDEPDFKSITMTASVSADGYFSTVKVLENYLCWKNVMVLGDTLADTTVESVYSFESFNREISMPSFVALISAVN